MANNKIVLEKIGEDPEVLIDLTADTVTEKTLAKGVTAHNAAGEIITGTYESSFIIDKDSETLTIVNSDISA